MVKLIVSQSPCSKAAKLFKNPPFSNTTKFHPACPVLQSTWPSNSGKRSDAFHSTSENSENLNWWFLLNWKRPETLVNGKSSSKKYFFPTSLFSLVLQYCSELLTFIIWSVYCTQTRKLLIYVHRTIDNLKKFSTLKNELSFNAALSNINWE